VVLLVAVIRALVGNVKGSFYGTPAN